MGTFGGGATPRAGGAGRRARTLPLVAGERGPARARRRGTKRPGASAGSWERGTRGSTRQRRPTPHGRVSEWLAPQVSALPSHLARCSCRGFALAGLALLRQRPRCPLAGRRGRRVLFSIFGLRRHARTRSVTLPPLPCPDPHHFNVPATPLTYVDHFMTSSSLMGSTRPGHAREWSRVSVHRCEASSRHQCRVQPLDERHHAPPLSLSLSEGRLRCAV